MICLCLDKGDIDQMITLYADNFSDGWNKNQLQSSFETGRFIALGVKESGELVGVITLTLGLDDADLECIVVKKSKLNCGIATFLMEQGIAVVKEKGINKILLEVRKSNTPAINLYQKFNFKAIHVRKGYYPDGEDAVIMQGDL